MKAPPRPQKEAREQPVPLDGLAYGIDHLDAIVALTVADAHVHAAWIRADAGFEASRIATTLLDAYRACHAGMRALGPRSASSEPLVTMETSLHILVMRRVRSCLVAILFDRAMPLGMARLMAARVAAAIEPELPETTHSGMPGIDAQRPAGETEDEASVPTQVFSRPTSAARPRKSTRPLPPRSTLSELDRARRLLAHLDAHAPEPHVVRLRVALRTGLTPLALEHPEMLGAEAVVLLETAAQEILGIDRTELRSVT